MNTPHKDRPGLRHLRRRNPAHQTKDLGSWNPADTELLAAVDTVIRDHTLTEEQWTRLADRYGTAGIIEIVMLAGPRQSTFKPTCTLRE